MNCPHCDDDNKSFVYRTEMFDGKVYRQRGCDCCEGVFFTVETGVSGWPQGLWAAKSRANRSQRVPAGLNGHVRTPDLKGDASALAAIWGSVVGSVPRKAVPEDDSQTVKG